MKKIMIIKDIVKKILSNLLGFIIKREVDVLRNTPEEIQKISNHFSNIVKVFPQITLRFYLTNYIYFINKWEKSQIIDFKDFLILHFEQFDDECKMLIYQLLYYLDFWDETIVKKLVNFATNTDNKSFRYWVTMDISFSSFLKQRGIYPDFYADRRELLKKISQDLQINHVTKTKNYNRDKKKLCVVTYILSNSIRNSMQRITTVVVDNLSKYYDEVLIISTESLYVSKRERHEANTLFPRDSSCSILEEARGLFKSNNICIKCAGKGTVKDRYSVVYSEIITFNPDVIIDMTDEFSPLSEILYYQFPVVYLPLRGYVSSERFDLILVPKSIGNEVNSQYRLLHDKQMADWAIPMKLPDYEEPFNRSRFNIPESAFIIITVGNIRNLCTNEFVRAVGETLKKKNNFYWLLIGDEIMPQIIQDLYPDFVRENRIQCHGYQTNLAAIIGMSNVLLRPNNTGGSGIAEIAAVQRKPIAMTNYLCDAMRWLGRDYSTSSNYEEVMEYIIQLSIDKKAYVAAQNDVYQRLVSFNVKNTWSSLQVKIEELIRDKSLFDEGKVDAN